MELPILLQILNSTQDQTIRYVGITIDTWVQISLSAATIVLVILTVLGNRSTNKHTENQLELTRKEIEYRIKPDLQIIIQESDLKKKEQGYEGFVKIAIKNNGVISARKIRVSFKDPTSSLDLQQLVRDEDEIKRTVFPVPGSIPPQSQFKDIMHRTLRDEYTAYDVAVWITYDYADVKNAEFIQILKINAQSNDLGPIYEHNDIEEARQHKQIGF